MHERTTGFGDECNPNARSESVRLEIVRLRYFKITHFDGFHFSLFFRCLCLERLEGVHDDR